MKLPILLTGDRPTGSLHLGHYIGSVVNRLSLQNTYRCFFIVADLHTLTTRHTLREIEQLPATIREMVCDYLACGIDPQLSVIYLQSAVSEVTELNLLLSQLVSLARLQRIPSLREMAQNAGISDMTLGLLGYPVLQAADILLAKAQVVPVGRDNEAHLELTRELARRFNYTYGCDFFPEPKTIFSEVPTLVGLDGKAKMSKSLSNAIFLLDEDKVLLKKIMSMYTDPNRIRADIPGETQNNPVFIYHRAFNSNKEEVAQLTELYQKGQVTDVEVKQRLYEALRSFLAPIQERRQQVLTKKGYIEKILFEGTSLMRQEAQATLKELKKIMGLGRIWNGISRKAQEFYKLQDRRKAESV